MTMCSENTWLNYEEHDWRLRVIRKVMLRINSNLISSSKLILNEVESKNQSRRQWAKAHYYSIRAYENLYGTSKLVIENVANLLNLNSKARRQSTKEIN